MPTNAQFLGITAKFLKFNNLNFRNLINLINVKLLFGRKDLIIL